MLPDLSHIFTRYEQLRNRVDALFARIAREYGDCLVCGQGCSDCCHALFDLSLVEAIYINRSFRHEFAHGPARSAILERAATVDRKLTRMKRSLFLEEKAGQAVDEIMDRASSMRIACPLLENNICQMYDYRPITCRLYGIPASIGGKSHVCGFSNFRRGVSYPTVNIDVIQQQLSVLSQEITVTLQSRFTELHNVYVPLSMALLTEYNETYLGMGPADEET